jgi:hypothetical protein
VGVLPPVAALALLGAAFLMWWMWGDLGYLVSPRAPLELGAEGDYRLEIAQSNRFAQLHGVPSARGWYAREKDGDFVLLAVADTPLVVRRSTFPDELPGPDGKRPQPLQNPFFARGRLLSRAEAGRYAGVLAQIEAWSGQPVKWLLLADQRPGADLGTLVSFGFLTLFASLNGWLLVQGLRRPGRRG